MEIIFGIVQPKPLDCDIKLIFLFLFFIILWKFGRTKLTSDLCLSKKIQETLVQSSMIDTNQCALDIFGIGKGP